MPVTRYWPRTTFISTSNLTRYYFQTSNQIKVTVRYYFFTRSPIGVESDGVVCVCLSVCLPVRLFV